jgi:Putative DNA-binding domain
MTLEGPEKTVADFLARIYRGSQIETSIAELATILDVAEKESVLGKAQAVQRFCDEFKLLLTPSLTQRGDLSTPRLLRSEVEGPVTLESVRDEISKGETELCEFKASFQYDFERAKRDPKATVSDLKAEKVMYAALRTIAAFLNSSGGTLYIGVHDKGEILGLEYDFQLLPQGMRNLDGWQLTIRDQIADRFREGANINDYIRITFVPIDDKWIARIEVAARKRLSFLRSQKAFALYRRQGNRTAEIHVEELEDFLASRRN